jgi:hypothetical protein
LNEIILGFPIPKIPDCQIVAAVASTFEVWTAYVWAVAYIAAILGRVDTILDFEEHILDPCFDIACLVAVADCLQTASTVEVVDEVNVEDEGIAEWLEDCIEGKLDVNLDAAGMAATFVIEWNNHMECHGPWQWMP